MNPRVTSPAPNTLPHAYVLPTPNDLAPFTTKLAASYGRGSIVETFNDSLPAIRTTYESDPIRVRARYSSIWNQQVAVLGLGICCRVYELLIGDDLAP